MYEFCKYGPTRRFCEQTSTTCRLCAGDHLASVRCSSATNICSSRQHSNATFKPDVQMTKHCMIQIVQYTCVRFAAVYREQRFQDVLGGVPLFVWVNLLWFLRFHQINFAPCTTASANVFHVSNHLMPHVWFFQNPYVFNSKIAGIFCRPLFLLKVKTHDVPLFFVT